jgi:hypothetical protein
LRINLSPKTGGVEAKIFWIIRDHFSFSFFWLEPKGGLSVKKQPGGLF